MLVTGKEILDKANKENIAVGAFNINNMECLQAVIAAAEKKQSAVIIQTSEGAIKYAGLDYLASMVKLAAQKASVPIALHLDHGTTYETIINCIVSGWTSVMFDGSHYDLENNIKYTKEIVKVAHACGVSVEAELGRLSGVEDQIAVDEKDVMFTDPNQAKIFVQETGVDSLAIAIGTAHGVYKGEPKLDFERLLEIKSLLKMPIVLHGASGISAEDLKKAIKLGVNKINIDTDIRLAFKQGFEEVLKNKPEEFDPRKLCGSAREKVQKVVENKIDIFSLNI
ncbi:MAG: class II fructose-1,6-bisphosphate aldolase [Oscillospiraceae bacterium]|nr:class II fructose-1,6-bisphosphate aldolase [Oscillospiraceae bacterium]